MKHSWMKGLALLALASGIGAAYAAGLPEPQKNEDLRREISTMARVLDDSMDRAGLGEGDWRGGGFGGWGSAVRGEFIPTVGALFTVRVNFPLVPAPEKSDERAGAEGKDDDLWERHQRASDRPDIFLRPEDAPVSPDDLRSELRSEIEENIRVEIAGLDRELADVDREVEIALREADGEVRRGVAEGLAEARAALEREHAKGEISEEERDRAIAGLEEARARMHEHRDVLRERGREARNLLRGRRRQFAPKIDLQMDFAPGFVVQKRLVSGPGDAPVRVEEYQRKYDEGRVLKLRQTLIEALAKYGHRLEHLDPSLKIMVRVEGPPPGRAVEIRRMFKSDGPDRQGDISERIERKLEEKVERRGDAHRVTIRKRGEPDVVRLGGPAIGRYVLSAKKGDLSAATTAAELEGKIEEHRY